MAEKLFWRNKYPQGIPAEIKPVSETIVDVFESSCLRFADKPAFSNMGHTISFRELDRYSADFAAYIQNYTGLERGDRVAVQLPNILQFPIVLFGLMRAGMVVVNTNPLYTEREMQHQFNDSGAKALIVLENMAHSVQAILPKTGLELVIVTSLGDMLPAPKRHLVNFVVRKIKKMVPDYDLPEAKSFRDCMRTGAKHMHRAVSLKPDDLAVLQYTGGTTGVAKGAMLSHRNLVANMMQIRTVLRSHIREGEEIMITPLPLYHIFSFTVNCMAMIQTGNLSVLITNPRDIPAFVKELKRWRFTCFTGLNTLFNALCNNEDFCKLDFSSLHITCSGGMALTQATAKRWQDITGCTVAEGYGMTETSPVVTINPIDQVQVGSIGMPVPSTEVQLIDEQGQAIPMGSDQEGELCVKGPQVMSGYWQKPKETAETFTTDGWLRTGDIAVIQGDGYLKIVDRKKDMIIVSGFNVYPNELEDVLSAHPDVVECAAVGVPSEKSGEVVKMYVVPRGDKVSSDELREYCRSKLTTYKIPKEIEFREELPKTNVGKILRRQLRDESTRVH